MGRPIAMLAKLLRQMQLLQLCGCAALAFWLARGFDWSAAAALAAGLGTPLAIHAAIIGVDFVIARWAASTTPPQFRIGALRGALVYFRELLDSIVVFHWAQPWLTGVPLCGESNDQARRSARSGRGRTAPSTEMHGPGPSGDPKDDPKDDPTVCGATDTATPVLLIHGFFCNRQIWRPMARWLTAAGHPIRGVDLEPVFAPIDSYVPAIDQAVRALHAACGGRPVALLCHSMGGLAARAYLRRHPDAPVCRVITIGSPHQGTVHACFGQGPNLRQLRPGSAWLTELSAGEDAQFRERITIVLSHHDNIVAPQSSQTLAGATTVEVGGLGHVSLVRSPRIGNLVIDALAAKHNRPQGAETLRR